MMQMFLTKFRPASQGRIFVGILICLGLISATADAQRNDKLSKKDLKTLIATATSTADHKRLAAYYRDEGERLQIKQKDHQQEASEYFKDPSHHPSPPSRPDCPE